MAESVGTTHNLYSVYVGHLDKSVTQKDLADLFAKFGTPRRLYIAEQRGPYTYGFVRFTLRESARDAILEMDGKIFRGRQLRVEMSTDNKHGIELSRDIKEQAAKKPVSKIADKNEINTKKVLDFKLAVRDYNGTVGSGPSLAEHNILNDLSNMSASPSSTQNTCSFKGEDYLNELISSYKDCLKKPCGRITPLVQAKEIQELKPPWLTANGTADRHQSVHSSLSSSTPTVTTATTSHPCKATSCVSSNGTQSPTTDVTLPTTFNSIEEKVPKAITNMPVTPPTTLNNIKEKVPNAITNMPDLVIGHQSVDTSGYGSASSNSADDESPGKPKTTISSIPCLEPMSAKPATSLKNSSQLDPVSTTTNFSEASLSSTVNPYKHFPSTVSSYQHLPTLCNISQSNMYSLVNSKPGSTTVNSLHSTVGHSPHMSSPVNTSQCLPTTVKDHKSIPALVNSSKPAFSTRGPSHLIPHTNKYNAQHLSNNFVRSHQRQHDMDSSRQGMALLKQHSELRQQRAGGGRGARLLDALRN